MRDMELELESEFELEHPGLGESEFETLGEGPLGEGPLGEGPLGEGPLGEGPLGEGPLGEGPLGEGPLGEYEDEQFLGGLLQGVGGLLGLGESEYEDEAFFGKAFKGIGSLIRRAAPILKQVAKTAAPIVGGAIGGPLGGKIGSMVGQFLRESEWEGEFEFEGESEAEFEAVMEGPLTEQQGLGELMAAVASKAATDIEAEAQIGGAIAISLSPSDRDTLKSVIPSLTRGAAVLTRILRRQPATRVVVRAVPTIVKRTAVSLKKQAAAGKPVTKKAAAKTMARQTRKVLSSTPVCARAVQRNVKATQAIAKRTRAQAFAW